jgi:hypothetical protein
MRELIDDPRGAYMIEMLMGLAIGIVTIAVAFAAFTYGLKCGQRMTSIPKFVEPKQVDAEGMSHTGPYG